MGRFIDDETEIEFIQSRVKKSSNAVAPAKDFDSENGIPNLPKIERKSSFTPVILIQNTNADYQILDLGLTIILDKNLQNVGIWIPETVLDEDIKVRYHSRFFVRANHEITYSSIGNKPFFNASFHRQTYQNQEKPPQRLQNSEFRSHQIEYRPTFLLKNFENFLKYLLYFLKMCLIFVSSVLDMGSSDVDMIW